MTYRPKPFKGAPKMPTLTEALAQGNYHGYAWVTIEDIPLVPAIARAPGVWPVSERDISSTDWVTFVRDDTVPWFFVHGPGDFPPNTVCAMKVTPFNERLSYLPWDPHWMYTIADAPEAAKAHAVVQALQRETLFDDDQRRIAAARAAAYLNGLLKRPVQ